MTKSRDLDLITYRMNRARETFREVDIHIQNKLWNTAVNRLYYACYYAITALLLSKDIKVQTHSGARQMFGLHFIKPGLIDNKLGKFYSDLFDKRQMCDYDDFTDITREDVMDLIVPAKELIKKIEDILKK